MEKGQFITDQAKKINDAGNYFPIWGTCLGFERLALFTASDPDNVLVKYGAEEVSLDLMFTANPTYSKMFCQMSSDQIAVLHDDKATYNSHKNSISPLFMKSDIGLRSFWTVTSVSINPGREFVATMEANHYPFMATQFHPEKPSQVVKGDHINRSTKSIQINRYFGDQFVDMARANPNTWGTYEEASTEIIQNYPIVITDTAREDIYVF